MSNSTDRVVVTGFGTTTPLGGDAPSTWRALLDGQSGAALLDDEWAADLPVRIAARAASDPADVLPRRGCAASTVASSSR